MIEIRYAPINFAQESNIILGIGSEHCCLQFIDEVTSFLKSNSKYNYKFRLITPKIDQNHTKEVTNLIEKVLELHLPDSIVVNDLGLLFYLKGRDISLTLGRVLTGSIGYRAKIDPFLDPEETHDIVINALAPSILHRKKIELYRSFGVSAVEICPMHYEDEYIEIFKQYDMKINLHHNSFISAISKICYDLGEDTHNNPNCKTYCKNPKKLKLAEFSPDVNISAKEQEFKDKQSNFPDYFLSGNVIYHISDKMKATSKYYDTIIYDYRFFTDEIDIHKARNENNKSLLTMP